MYLVYHNSLFSDRAKLVKNAIEKLNQTGVVITSITCDNTQVNITMLNNLGARISANNMKVTLDKKNSENKPIFVIMDVAHLIKLIRNTLGDMKTLISPDGQVVSWKYVKELNNLQSTEGLHMANKLRKSHVEYTKHKMKVNLAAQTISDSVATSIDFCRDHLKLTQFQNSESTTTFFRIFDKIFDVMNSRSPIGRFSKSPMKITNSNDWLKTFDDTMSYILRLKHDGGPLVIEGSVTHKALTFNHLIMGQSTVLH